MSDDRGPGETFAPEDIGWIDFETRSPTPIRAGAYRYMAQADATVLAFAIGSEPASAVGLTDFSRGPLQWDPLPYRFHAHHARVIRGEAVWAAFNAAFDKAAWNYATIGFPKLEPHHIIDVMAQATAAGLPPGLDGAARFAGVGRKASDGKKLIALFSDFAPGHATPATHPAQWAQFLAYAASDVEVMRLVFRHTLQLPRAEWIEYWRAEAVNERGVGCDLELAWRAADMAMADRFISSRELDALTSGDVRAATEVKRMIKWLRTSLDPEGRAILTKRVEETDEETGEIVKEAKHSLARARLRLLVAYLENKVRTPREDAALRLLLIRQYGGSTTPAKFGRMREQHVDGVLMGQYAFGGAPQTGRFSSRGVQIHNLMRDALPYETDAIDALTAGCTPAEFAKLGDDTPISRKLSMLIRPTLVPTQGEVFCWGDWSQIEARVTPWLAGDAHPGAADRLDIFREVDADHTLPDLYTRTTAAMMGIDVSEVTKPLRQRGKVAELALGFCGGRGALQNMAAAYGMHLSDEEAQQIVDQWRSVNPWAIDYSRELWEAVRNAQRHPEHTFAAGRITAVFLPDYLGGSLLLQLPSGRVLTYRKLRWEYVNEVDDDGAITARNLELMFSRGYGRIKLWPGFFVENVTQAVAADVLRGTIVRLVEGGYDVRAHTHDEVLLQCPLSVAGRMQTQLIDVMEQGFDWSAELPLKAEPSCGYAYTKCEGAQGL